MLLNSQRYNNTNIISKYSILDFWTSKTTGYIKLKLTLKELEILEKKYQQKKLNETINIYLD
jgi:hypothetical protein